MLLPGGLRWFSAVQPVRYLSGFLGLNLKWTLHWAWGQLSQMDLLWFFSCLTLPEKCPHEAVLLANLMKTLPQPGNSTPGKSLGIYMDSIWVFVFKSRIFYLPHYLYAPIYSRKSDKCKGLTLSCEIQKPASFLPCFLVHLSSFASALVFE